MREDVKKCVDGLRELESKEFLFRSDMAGHLLLESARLLEVLSEDLRVTNGSADFHMKECQRLREEIEKMREKVIEREEEIERIRTLVMTKYKPIGPPPGCERPSPGSSQGGHDFTGLPDDPFDPKGWPNE